MEDLLKGDFCELTGEEMVSVLGGGPLKDIVCLTVGSVLAGNAVLIGFLATPAVGIMAVGTGLELLGEGSN